RRGATAAQVTGAVQRGPARPHVQTVRGVAVAPGAARGQGLGSIGRRGRYGRRGAGGSRVNITGFRSRAQRAFEAGATPGSVGVQTGSPGRRPDPPHALGGRSALTAAPGARHAPRALLLSL